MSLTLAWAIVMTVVAALALFAWSGAATRARQMAERADYWRDIAAAERNRNRPTADVIPFNPRGAA